MKKILFLFVVLFATSLFTSCTDDTDIHEDIAAQQTQATDKGDSSNPNNNGGGNPTNEED